MTIALILWYRARLLHADVVDLGLLFVFYDYMRKFIQPLQELSARYSEMQSSMASLERISSFSTSSPSPGGPLSVRGAIKLQNVTFAYNAGDSVLRNLSFASLLANASRWSDIPARARRPCSSCSRACDPQQGRILLDGVDIRDPARGAAPAHRVRPAGRVPVQRRRHLQHRPSRWTT